jgi:hypothetical protein
MKEKNFNIKKQIHLNSKQSIWNQLNLSQCKSVFINKYELKHQY